MTVWNWEKDGPPNALRRVIGLPSARRNDDGTVTCPRCGKRISGAERRDFESYSWPEYRDHYEREHAVADGHVNVNGVWYEPV
jgi:hypothetical protein